MIRYTQLHGRCRMWKVETMEMQCLVSLGVQTHSSVSNNNTATFVRFKYELQHKTYSHYSYWYRMNLFNYTAFCRHTNTRWGLGLNSFTWVLLACQMFLTDQLHFIYVTIGGWETCLLDTFTTCWLLSGKDNQKKVECKCFSIPDLPFG